MLNFIKSLCMFICLSLSPQEAHSTTEELSHYTNYSMKADNMDSMIVLKYRVNAMEIYR